MRNVKLLLLPIAAAVLVLSLAGVLHSNAPQPDGPSSALKPQGDWADPAIWNDGLVEKATYDATKVIYGKSRNYEATFLTNREVHTTTDRTKAPDGQGIEVWKHNQIEVVPTPNYDYKFVTTSHLRADDLLLTRLDATSQEWCGTSFHQFLLSGVEGTPTWDFFGFSYMPGAGRQEATVTGKDLPTIPFNALPVALRAYDFEAGDPLAFRLIRDQRNNRATQANPIDAVVTLADATGDGYELALATAAGEPVGRFTFAKDRQHVMLRYDGEDGQTYKLTGLDRVDYWTIDE